MGNRSVWGELGDEGLAEDELLAEVRALLGGLNPAPELSLSETESARADHVLSRLLIDTTSAPPDDPRRREGPGPSHRGRWPLAPSSKKRAAIALGVAACAAALVATVAVVALQGDRNPAVGAAGIAAPIDLCQWGPRRRRFVARACRRPAGLAALWAGWQVPVRQNTELCRQCQRWWDAQHDDHVRGHYRPTGLGGTGLQGAREELQPSDQRHYRCRHRGPGPESTDEHWVDTNCGFPTSASAVVARLVGADGSDMDRQDRDYALADGAMAQLGLGTATPRQVAALYRVLESLPGVFYAGTVTDDAGRLGQAVGVPSGLVNTPPTPVPKNLFVPAGCAHAKGGAGWDYFVLSPKTGQPLEVEEVDSRHRAPCACRRGLLLGSTTWSWPQERLALQAFCRSETSLGELLALVPKRGFKMTRYAKKQSGHTCR